MNQVTKMTAQQIFRAAVKGNNFMTPDIIRYDKLTDNMVVELSEGSGLSSERIFGVSVATANEQDGKIEYTYRYDLNKKCDSRAEAEEYIAKLRKDANKKVIAVWGISNVASLNVWEMNADEAMLIGVNDDEPEWVEIEHRADEEDPEGDFVAGVEFHGSFWRLDQCMRIQ